MRYLASLARAPGKRSRLFDQAASTSWSETAVCSSRRLRNSSIVRFSFRAACSSSRFSISFTSIVSRRRRPCCSSCVSCGRSSASRRSAMMASPLTKARTSFREPWAAPGTGHQMTARMVSNTRAVCRAKRLTAHLPLQITKKAKVNTAPELSKPIQAVCPMPPRRGRKFERQTLRAPFEIAGPYEEIPRDPIRNDQVQQEAGNAVQTTEQ